MAAVEGQMRGKRPPLLVMARSDSSFFPRKSKWPLAACVAAAALAACSKAPPRSFQYFMDDSIARDGVIARCARDEDEARTDIECANARRAALAVQLQEERERRERLERESAAQLEALRRQIAAREQALRRPADDPNAGSARSDEGSPVGADDAEP